MLGKDSNMDITKINLIAMDLDGTLTQHKSEITNHVKELLNKLAAKYKLLIIGAGSCRRIYEQMDKYPIDIIGHYGMQKSSIDTTTGEIVITSNVVADIDKELFIHKVNKLRRITGYINYTGDTIEFHNNGAVTLPLLGTKADKYNKLTFDPTREKRREILPLIKQEFEKYSVFIGGTSSFDIVPFGFNKYNALIDHINTLSLSPENVVYFGDDYGMGGNDEDVFLSDIQFVCIDNYTDFPEKIQCFLI